MLRVEMSAGTPNKPLPVDAVKTPAGHRDVRAEVFAAIPPRAVPFKKRLFWTVLLAAMRVPGLPALLQKLRSR
jgi:hypothetical protein